MVRTAALSLVMLMAAGWLLSALAEEDDDSFCPMAALAGNWEIKTGEAHELVTFKWNKDKKYLEMTSKCLADPQNPQESKGPVCYDAKNGKLYYLWCFDDGRFLFAREVKRQGKDVYLEINMFNFPNQDRVYMRLSFSDDLILTTLSLELDNWVDMGSVELRRIE